MMKAEYKFAAIQVINESKKKAEELIPLPSSILIANALYFFIRKLADWRAR
jgi:hypothetical protein